MNGSVRQRMSQRRARHHAAAITSTVVLATMAAVPVASAAAPESTTVWGATAAGTGGLGPGVGTGRATREDPSSKKILLMLDASGSMLEKDSSGQVKMDSAKKALKEVINGLEPGSEVGLRVYGETVDGGGKPTPQACKDSKLKVALAPLDKKKLTTAVDGTKPLGETPIAYSLTEAAKDLGAEGKRHIILVSDGEESCAPDPCAEVATVVKSGVDVRIDTVGMSLSPTARGQMECIASTTGGQYYDTKSSAQLSSSLKRVVKKANRPFTTKGTAIKATPKPEDGPVLGPGQYVDTFTGKDPARYFKIKRTPGSTITVSSTQQPKYTEYTSDSMRLTVTTPDGQECAKVTEYSAMAQDRPLAYTAVARIDGVEPDSTATPEACATQEELTVAVQRVDGTAVAPSEILISEEQPVPTAVGLPTAITDEPKATAVQPLAEKEVVGGGSFNDATPITSGTWVDMVWPGEEVFYKVDLDWGQSLSMTTETPGPGFTLPKEGYHSMTAYSRVYTPRRSEVWSPSGTYISNSDTAVRAQSYVTPEVRYLNREASSYGAHSAKGSYYIAVTAGTTSDEARSTPVPIRLHVKVNGKPHGAPTYGAMTAPTGGSSSTSTNTDAPTSTTSSSSGSAGPSSTSGNRPDGTPGKPESDDDGWSALEISALAGTVVLGLALAGAGFALGRRRTARTQ